MMRVTTVTVYTFDSQAEAAEFVDERFPARIHRHGEPGWYEVPGGTIALLGDTVIWYRRVEAPALQGAEPGYGEPPGRRREGAGARRGTMREKVELWGMREFCEALGISPNRGAQWRRRGKLPDPDYLISGRPIWIASRARRWIEGRKERRDG